MSGKASKGKQGTKGKKQIAEENQSTLKFYLYIIGCVNVLYYGVWFVFFWDVFTTGPVILSVFSAVVYFFSFHFMSRMAKSVYNAGQLVDPGVDLNMESGLAEHIKDLILLTAIVQTCSLLSSYFWLFLLLAPGRAFYMLWVNLLGPWFLSPAEEQQVDEKKQRRMERKMKRQQVIR